MSNIIAGILGVSCALVVVTICGLLHLEVYSLAEQERKVYRICGLVILAATTLSLALHAAGRGYI